MPCNSSLICFNINYALSKHIFNKVNKIGRNFRLQKTVLSNLAY